MAIRRSASVALTLLLVVAVVAPVASALTFDLSKGTGLLALEAGTAVEQQMAADFYTAFQAAGDIWSRRLTDAITVRLTIDYQPLDAGVLGTATTITMGESYSQVRSALQADSLTSYDALAAANLQDGARLDMLINDSGQSGYAPVIRDNDATANNVSMNVTHANARALGLLAADHSGSDGSIAFTTLQSWDFDRSDGIASGTFDFIATAAHELGHLLGFTSGVDAVDYSSAPDGPNAPLSLQNFRLLTVRDLYRYSAASLAESNQPASGAVLDMTTSDGAFLSLDAGQSVLGTVASGAFNGDGSQASHWTAGSGQGIMVPYQIAGRQGNLSHLDLTVMDVIGYDRTAASLGDFNDDATADAADIDLLLDALVAGVGDLSYDVSFDETLNAADLDALLADFVGATRADANLDGATNVLDFIVLKQNYNQSGRGWASGDFTGEGVVDIEDFVYLKQNYNTILGGGVAGVAGVAGAVGAAGYETDVPEPASALLLALAALPALRRRGCV